MPDLAWERNRMNIRKEFSDAAEHMPARPWMLATLGATMYVGAGQLLTQELHELAAAQVPGVLWGDGDVTNLLHQRYHLWHWQKNHPQYYVGGLRTIVEFGAGYGAMAIVASRMGFTGDYYMHDLPELERIQREHLPLRGLQCSVHHGQKFRKI
jgi:hypothetical protein